MSTIYERRKVFAVTEWTNWMEIQMSDFAVHVQGKRVLGTVSGSDYKGPWGWKDPEGIALDDGSAIVTVSNWDGPLSKETPDIDELPPKFYLSTVRK